MSRPRRSIKRTPIIESSSDSEDAVPVKKSKLSPIKLDKIPKENENDSSSDSDIENYLQPVDKLDFSSPFFNLTKNTDEEFNKSEKYDAIFSTRLPDSDSDLDNPKPSASGFNKKEENQVQDTTKTATLNFQELKDFTRKIEEAKIQVEKYNAKHKIKENNLNISNLLASGESTEIKAEDLHSSDFQTTDDEDWEEVKIKDQEEKRIVPEEDIEIRIDEMPKHCKKKKGVDFVAAMKRRLNRIRKENQIYVHKVHLLCWIAHGNFLNSVINNSGILGLALSLLPSDKCYPSDRINLKYLEQIIQWYKRTIRLTDKGPPQEITFMNALKLQIKRQEVYDKKMFVFIFIAILRALGVQCRMVLSFQVEPLRPPSSELHSLSNKQANKKNKSSKSAQSSSSPDKTSKKKEVSNVKDSKLETEGNSRKTVRTSIQKSLKNKENLRLKLDRTKDDKEKCNELKNKGRKGNVNLVKLKDTKEENTDTFLAVKNHTEKRSRNPDKENIENVTSGITQTRSTRKKAAATKEVSDTDKEISLVKLKTTSKSKVGSPVKDITEVGIRRRLRNSSRNWNNDEGEKTENDRNGDMKSKDGLSVREDQKLRSKRAETNKTFQESKTRSKSTNSVLKVIITPFTRNKDRRKDVPQLDGANDDVKSKSGRRKLKVVGKTTKNTSPVRKNSRRLKSTCNDDDSEHEFSLNPVKQSTEKKYRDRMAKKRNPPVAEGSSDSDYIPEPVKKQHQDSDSDIEYSVPKSKAKKINSFKRLQADQPFLSDSDDESRRNKKEGNNVWLEVFLENEEKWITVDVIRGKVHCVNELYMGATHPVNYIVAWNNDHTIKDVTMRYCKNFTTVTRKLRIEPKWWEETIKPFIEKITARSKEEDHDLYKQQLDQPLPKAISEYKNHPLYALERHLLQFEVIYPSETAPVGFIRSEPVYPRNCVYTCKSRDRWMKEAKVMKLGEKPYKVVKRPKWDKFTKTILKGQPLEIFGEWQTTDYIPPTAENGVVPRNEYGNVELFKPCMIPKGTVHLKLPGLNKICRKLNIDCATALVGFDSHRGWVMPMYDGFVVCSEFTDTLIAAWDMEQEEIKKKEHDKKEKRVYTNWKKLIRGLLIKEKLKARYNFGEETSKAGKGKNRATTSKGSNLKKLHGK